MSLWLPKIRTDKPDERVRDVAIYRQFVVEAKLFMPLESVEILRSHSVRDEVLRLGYNLLSYRAVAPLRLDHIDADRTIAGTSPGDRTVTGAPL